MTLPRIDQVYCSRDPDHRFMTSLAEPRLGVMRGQDACLLLTTIGGIPLSLSRAVQVVEQNVSADQQNP